MDTADGLPTAAWLFHAHSHLMVPRDLIASSSISAAPDAVIAYISTAESIALQPWPSVKQVTAEEASVKQVTAEEAHAAAVAQQVPSTTSLRGYASWLTPGALHVDNPLFVCETTRHMGTRVWTASWLHRAWALSNRHQLFADASSTRVHEMGAGCGLLGLSLAASCGVHVMLSDFRGHDAECDDADTVVGNLCRNAARNRDIIAAAGGSARVVELDWAQPDTATVWDAVAGDSSEDGVIRRGAEVPLEPADIVLATEVLYSEAGAASFVEALARLLRRPAGACFLMNNHRRTTASFEAVCARAGLSVERLPNVEPSGVVDELVSTFAPPWDEDEGLYGMLKITWAPRTAGL